MFIDELDKIIFISESRDYIGASQIGHSCDRLLWLNRYQPKEEKLNYRQHDIFERGNLEEDRIIAHLDRCGFKVMQQQVGVKYKSLKGHVDAVIKDKDTGDSIVLEMKTMNDRSFKAWLKNGSQETNFTYFIQCQCYMGLLGINKALLVVRNKNDETLAEEIIEFDKNIYELHLKKMERIEGAKQMPLGFKALEKQHFSCKWCKYKQECWSDNE